MPPSVRLPPPWGPSRRRPIRVAGQCGSRHGYARNLPVIAGDSHRGRIE